QVAHAQRRVVRDVGPAAGVAPRDRLPGRAPAAGRSGPAAHAAVAARAEIGAPGGVDVGRARRRVGGRLLVQERDLAEIALVGLSVAVVVAPVARLGARLGRAAGAPASSGARLGARAARARAAARHALVDAPLAVVVAVVAALGARRADRHDPEARAHLVVDVARLVSVVGVTRAVDGAARGGAAVVVVRDGLDPRVPAVVADAHSVHPRDRLRAGADAGDVDAPDHHVRDEVDRRLGVAGDVEDAIALAAQGVVVGAGVELEHAEAALAGGARAVACARYDGAAAAVWAIRSLARPGQLRPAVRHVGLGVGDAGEQPPLGDAGGIGRVADLPGAHPPLR